jgi:hypothetical protein
MDTVANTETNMDTVEILVAEQQPMQAEAKKRGRKPNAIKLAQATSSLVAITNNRKSYRAMVESMQNTIKTQLDEIKKLKDSPSNVETMRKEEQMKHMADKIKVAEATAAMYWKHIVGSTTTPI